MRLTSLVFLLATTFAVPVFAAEQAVTVTRAVARATVPGQPSAAVYLTLANKGAVDDTLIAVTTPAAKSAELHTMSMTDNVMRMREVGQVALPAASTVTMAAGSGYHVMLIGVTQPLLAGQQFPLTLTFGRAGKVETRVSVEAMAGMH